jgi:hypothetical protein
MALSKQVAVRWDGKFGVFYERVKARRGDQKAVVAVANKMLKIVWVMLIRREMYGNVNRRLFEEKINRIGMDR